MRTTAITTFALFLATTFQVSAQVVERLSATILNDESPLAANIKNGKLAVWLKIRWSQL